VVALRTAISVYQPPNGWKLNSRKWKENAPSRKALCRVEPLGGDQGIFWGRGGLKRIFPLNLVEGKINSQYGSLKVPVMGNEAGPN